MKKRILKDMIKQQDLTCGVILSVIDPDIAENVALAGVDFIVLDLEHTGKTIESAYPCIMVGAAYNIPILTRTADKDQYLIEQALDAGCQGVVIPTVETVEECISIVKSAKFAPMGDRGYCPMDITTRWMNDNSSDPLIYANNANRDTFVMPLIETPLGFKNLPEMVKVEGIDAFHLGPADLGMRLGKHMWDPEVERMIVEATEIINNSGKICITIATQDNIAQQYKKGARAVITSLTIGTLIKKTYAGEIEALKSIALSKG